MAKTARDVYRKRLFVISPTASRYRKFCEENRIKPGRDALYCLGPDSFKGIRPDQFNLVWDEEVWFKNIRNKEWVRLNRMAIQQGFNPAPSYKIESF